MKRLSKKCEAANRARGALTGRRGGCLGGCEVAPAAFVQFCGCRRERAREKRATGQHLCAQHQPSPAARNYLAGAAALDDG